MRAYGGQFITVREDVRFEQRTRSQNLADKAQMNDIMWHQPEHMALDSTM